MSQPTTNQKDSQSLPIGAERIKSGHWNDMTIQQRLEERAASLLKQASSASPKQARQLDRLLKPLRRIEAVMLRVIG